MRLVAKPEKRAAVTHAQSNSSSAAGVGRPVTTYEVGRPALRCARLPPALQLAFQPTDAAIAHLDPVRELAGSLQTAKVDFSRS